MSSNTLDANRAIKLGVFWRTVIIDLFPSQDITTNVTEPTS